MTTANYTAIVKKVKIMKNCIAISFEDAKGLGLQRRKGKINEGLLKKLEGEPVTIFTDKFPTEGYNDIKSILYQGVPVYQIKTK